jgi:hypothetical protein
MMAIRVLCEWLLDGENVAKWVPLFETCKNAMDAVQMKREVLRMALNRARRCLQQIPRDHREAGRRRGDRHVPHRRHHDGRLRAGSR